MPLNLGSVRIDAAAVDDLVTDPDGIVGDLIFELSARAAIVARGAAHVYPGTPKSTIWNPLTSTARFAMPPGHTRGSIHTHGPYRGTRGGMYGGVNVNVFPTVFLEFPAWQMYDRYPFMTTGLESLEGTI
jgi:hypothetical protein